MDFENKTVVAIVAQKPHLLPNYGDAINREVYIVSLLPILCDGNKLNAELFPNTGFISWVTANKDELVFAEPGNIVQCKVEEYYKYNPSESEAIKYIVISNSVNELYYNVGFEIIRLPTGSINSIRDIIDSKFTIKRERPLSKFALIEWNNKIFGLFETQFFIESDDVRNTFIISFLPYNIDGSMFSIESNTFRFKYNKNISILDVVVSRNDKNVLISKHRLNINMNLVLNKNDILMELHDNHPFRFRPATELINEIIKNIGLFQTRRERLNARNIMQTIYEASKLPHNVMQDEHIEFLNSITIDNVNSDYKLQEIANQIIKSGAIDHELDIIINEKVKIEIDKLHESIIEQAKEEHKHLFDDIEKNKKLLNELVNEQNDVKKDTDKAIEDKKQGFLEAISVGKHNYESYIRKMNKQLDAKMDKIEHEKLTLNKIYNLMKNTDYIYKNKISEQVFLIIEVLNKLGALSSDVKIKNTGNL